MASEEGGGGRLISVGAFPDISAMCFQVLLKVDRSRRVVCRKMVGVVTRLREDKGGCRKDRGRTEGRVTTLFSHTLMISDTTIASLMALERVSKAVLMFGTLTQQSKVCECGAG